MFQYESMSALLENKVFYFKSKIDKNTCSFFKQVNPFHDMDHTQIARIRMRTWSEVINCVRYHCTLDWYINRNDINKNNNEIYYFKNDECLLLRILCRSAPSVTTFNNEAFLEELNTQYQNSTLIKNMKECVSK